MAALIKSQERAGGKPPRISRPVHPVKRLAPSKKKSKGVTLTNIFR